MQNFFSPNLYHIRLVPHLPDLGHVTELLLYQRRFKCHQHEQSEDAVIPVLIQAPQPNAEYLEHEKRRSSSLLEQLQELRDVQLHPGKDETTSSHDNFPMDATMRRRASH